MDPFSCRLRHACPAVCLATSKGRVRWRRSEGGREGGGKVGLGGRLAGEAGSRHFCWLGCCTAHTLDSASIPGNLPQTPDRLTVIPDLLQVQSPPLSPHIPTTSRPPTRAKAEAKPDQTPPPLHRHSRPTSPHLTSPHPPKPTMPRYIADNSPCPLPFSQSIPSDAPHPASPLPPLQLDSQHAAQDPRSGDGGALAGLGHAADFAAAARGHGARRQAGTAREGDEEAVWA